MIGFVPAYFTIGIEYALLWFAITGTRNIFVDMISGNGFKPSEWSAKDINITNLANSLFWAANRSFLIVLIRSAMPRDNNNTWSDHVGNIEFNHE